MLLAEDAAVPPTSRLDRFSFMVFFQVLYTNDYADRAELPTSLGTGSPKLSPRGPPDGHMSQGALQQAHADAWLGWTEIDGQGPTVAEVSPSRDRPRMV